MAERKVTIRVSVDDIDAGKKLDDLALKLDKLTKRTWTIKLRLDDGGAAAKLDKMAAKLDKIGHNTYTPKIKTDGITKADAQVDKLNTKLDKLGHKRVTATVHVRSTGGSGGSLLGDILGLGGKGGGGGATKAAEEAAGGAGGGASGGILSAIAGASNSYAGIGIAALVALGAALTPALGTFGAGVGAGGLGALLAGRLGATGITKLQADRQALAQAQAAIRGATVPGVASPSQLLALRQAQAALAAAKTPAQRLAARNAIASAQASIAGSTTPGKASPSQILSLHQAQAQLARDQAKYGGFVPFGHALNNVKNDALGAFLTAVAGTGPGFSAGPHGQPGGSFLQGLVPILNQVGVFLKQIGPGLGEMFRASLPFIAAFAKIMEQSAKIILPAFTQSLRSLTPFLPQIIKGFVILAQGVASFIKDLGPGMKDSVTVFLGLMNLAKGLLIALAYAADYTAKFLANFGHVSVDVARFVVKEWDKLKSGTIADWDAVRHFIAAAWDKIYQDVLVRAGKLATGVLNWTDRLRHTVSNDYDLLRHYIATEWDQIWNNTVGRVQRGVQDVENWFNKLPSGIKSLLGGLGKMLLGIATGAMNDFLSGLKSVGSTVLGWIKSFFTGIPSAIMKFLHMSPPHPGSAFYDLGANFMHHLEAGIKSRIGGVIGTISGVGGHVGGNVNSWIVAALHAAGKPMSWLPALQRLVQLESGGNPRAVDPISVMGEHAEGLWQMLPSTFFGYGGRGSLFNPIIEGIAALRYISSRYGSPFNIPGLFSGGYRGYASGGIITEPIIGAGLRTGMTYSFGERGLHERVTPLGSGSGGNGNIYINVTGDFANPDATALRIIQVIRKYKQHKGNAALGIA